MSGIILWKIDSNSNSVEKVQLDNHINNLDMTSKLIPQGAYTTFRTYNHSKVFHLNDHILRLEETARLSGVISKITINRENLRIPLRELINERQDIDQRIRITMDLEKIPGEIYLASEKLVIPEPDIFINGASVITQKLSRKNPKAKLTKFLSISESIKSKLPNNINEAIMVSDEGIMLEGLTSNFFAILKEQIWTEEKNVLSGITRSIVIEEAEKNGINIILSGSHIEKISDWDEVFITSTSRSVLPVNSVDSVLIGSGKPGPITKLLMDKYHLHIQNELENI